MELKREKGVLAWIGVYQVKANILLGFFKLSSRAVSDRSLLQSISSSLLLWGRNDKQNLDETLKGRVVEEAKYSGVELQ